MMQVLVVSNPSSIILGLVVVPRSGSFNIKPSI